MEQLLQQIQSLVSDRIELKMDGVESLPCGPFGALPSHLSRHVFRAFEVAYGWPAVFSAPDVAIESFCQDDGDDEEIYDLERDYMQRKMCREVIRNFVSLPNVAKNMMHKKNMKDSIEEEEEITNRLRAIRNSNFYDSSEEREIMVRTSFLDIILRIMLPFKTCLRARRNQLTNHKSRMQNLEYFHHTIEQDRK